MVSDLKTIVAETDQITNQRWSVLQSTHQRILQRLLVPGESSWVENATCSHRTGLELWQTHFHRITLLTAKLLTRAFWLGTKSMSSLPKNYETRMFSPSGCLLEQACLRSVPVKMLYSLSWRNNVIHTPTWRCLIFPCHNNIISGALVDDKQRGSLQARLDALFVLFFSLDRRQCRFFAGHPDGYTPISHAHFPA